MTPVGDIVLDSLHSTATKIFTGAVAACNIESAFDRRIRFEGDTMHRLIPDGSGPATRLVNRLNLLHWHRTPGNVHRAPVAVFIVFPFPDQLGRELRKRMRIVQPVACFGSSSRREEALTFRGISLSLVTSAATGLIGCRHCALAQPQPREF